MVEDRMYDQAPKRYHHEYFVLKRPTPGNPNYRRTVWTQQGPNVRPYDLYFCYDVIYLNKVFVMIPLRGLIVYMAFDHRSVLLL